MRADLPLRLHPLTLLADGDEVVIGRVDVDSYAVFPADGAALVQRLVDGATPQDAADWYRQEFGETVDLIDLVTTLHELDFVATEPAADFPATPEAASGAGPAAALRWQRLGRIAFSWPAWAAYAAVVAAAVALCAHDHGFLPHRDNAFFVHYLIVIEVAVALGQVPLILIHECFHVLAARRIGIPARIRVSHRLYFVVFETVMDGLVLAPRRRRYLPMLAGMLADVLVASLLTLGARVARDVGAPGLLGGLFLALALTTLVRLALEFLLFLRTDVYFLAATLGGCVDLHTTCREMVRNRLWRLLRREDRVVDAARWHPRDVGAARWYLPMYLLGYAVAIALLAIVLLPISWRFAHTAAIGVWHHDLASAHFWDAAALLALNGAQPAFAGLLALRERAQRHRDEQRRSQRRQTFLETTPADPHHPTDNRPTDHYPTDHHPTGDDMNVNAHLWFTAARVPRDVEPTLGRHDGHQRLRGPYTAAGSLMREIVPGILADDPELAARYDIEILAAAPELSAVLTNSRPTLTSEADPLTRTRYYPHTRTVWIGNGLVDLVLARAASLGGDQVLCVDRVDQLEPTDASWLAGLVRRADPAVLRVVCASATEPSGELAAILGRRAVSRPAPVLSDEPAGYPAGRFVAGHGTSDDADERRAYADLDAAARAALHDAEATRLAGLPDGHAIWGRGALAYHLEHGSDPAGAGAAGLSTAQEQCLMSGFYDAVVDLGHRIRKLLTWTQDQERYWLATVKMTVALQAMGRPDEAMDLFDDACANSVLPSVHMQAAYGRAMVYTRYYDEDRRDLRKAKGLVNTAVALAGLSTDAQRRAYNRTFNENGLALIDMHLGEVDSAVELIEAGIARLDREVEGGRYLLHRSVLRYNHAQLMVRAGRLDEAVEEYTRILAEDPFHPDYWFDRAGLYERLGRIEDAIADYTSATLAGPPYPEPHYNRAELLLRTGDTAGALTGYSRVLELDPAFLDAWINRAWLRLDDGDLDGARADVLAGLEIDPDQPHLLCLQGLVEQAAGSLDVARSAFESALRVDPALASGWASLGALLYGCGDAAGACDCLRRSLELADDPAVRDNLAVAEAAAGGGPVVAAV